MNQEYQEKHIRKILELCMQYRRKDEVLEIRALNCGEYYNKKELKMKTTTVCGFFDNIEECIEQVQMGNGIVRIYFGLNLRSIDVVQKYGQRINLMNVCYKGTSHAKDVCCIQWFAIDCDRKKNEETKNMPATNSELEQILMVRDKIDKFLANTYNIRCLRAMSGNGGHLLIPVGPYRYKDQFKNIAKTHENLLKHLSKEFSNEYCDIDIGIHNIDRIFKMYGTQAFKDIPGTLERPDRFAYIENLNFQRS